MGRSSTSLSDSDFLNSGLIEGVYSVKLPPNVRGKNSWKVWAPKLFRLEATKQTLFSSESILLTVFKCSKSRGVILRERLNPNRTIIFRCKSRKKPYAFSVYCDGRILVHISRNSESESQALMRSFRNLIWPVNPLLHLSKNSENVFEVSLIDNERSTRAGLLGASGHLALTESKAILSCIRTGDVIQEWYMNSVKFQIVPQKHPADKNKVLALTGDQKSSTGPGPILLYCEQGLILFHQVQDIKSKRLRNFTDRRPICGIDPSSYSTIWRTLVPRFDRKVSSDYQVPSRIKDLNLSYRDSLNNGTSTEINFFSDGLLTNSRGFSLPQDNGFHHYDSPTHFDRLYRQKKRNTLVKISPALLDSSLKLGEHQSDSRLYVNASSCLTLNGDVEENIYEEIQSFSSDKANCEEGTSRAKPPLPPLWSKSGILLRDSKTSYLNFFEKTRRRKNFLSETFAIEEQGEFCVISKCQSMTLPSINRIFESEVGRPNLTRRIARSITSIF